MRAIVLLSTAFAYLLWKLAATPEILEGQAQVGYSLDGSSGDEIDGILLLVGEAAVFLFYWFKFNEWAGEGDAPKGFTARPVRHFTTWLRFLAWGSTYGLLMLAAFNLMIFFPDIISGIIDSFARASADLQAPVLGLAEAQSLGNLLGQDVGTQRFLNATSTSELIPYAVILVTVVWAELHPFSQFERRFRHQLQERAAVPAQASDLMAILASHRIRFEPDSKVQAEVVKRSGGTLSETDFANVSEGTDAWPLYARIEYLFQQLQHYRFKPLFVGLSARYSSEYRDLEEHVLRLRTHIQTRLQEIRDELVDNAQNTLDPSDSKFKDEKSRISRLSLRAAEQELEELNEKEHSRLRVRHFENQYKEIQEELNGTWENIRKLMVCSILAVGRTPKHRQEMFDDFGLKLTSPIAIQLEWYTVILMASSVVSTVFVGSFVYDMLLDKSATNLPPHVPKGTPAIVWWAVTATMMHLVGAVGGYVTQRSLELRRERMSLGDPRAAGPGELAAETIMATTFAVTLNIALLALLFASGGQFNELVNGWWWAFLPGVTGAFTAKYSQDESQRRLKELKEPGTQDKLHARPLWIQAAVTGFTALGIVILLYYDDYAPTDRNMLLYAAYVSITATAIGLGFGWVLRSWTHNQTNELIEEDKRQKREAENLPEKRSNRRQYHAKANWHAEGQKFNVEVFSVSDKGAALRSKEALIIGSEGSIAIPRIVPVPRRAKITRQDDNDEECFYVSYLDKAA